MNAANSISSARQYTMFSSSTICKKLKVDRDKTPRDDRMMPICSQGNLGQEATMTESA